MTVSRIAALCSGRMVDSRAIAERLITCISGLAEAGPDAVSWISDQKYRRYLADTKAGAIIGPQDMVGEMSQGIVVSDPEAAIADVLDAFATPQASPRRGIHPTAIVDSSAVIAPDAAVGAHAVIHAEARVDAGAVVHEGVSIGRGVRIGENSVIYDRCVIYDHCEIGKRVIIHAGAVIGGDGFGYIWREGRHRKLAHVGTVVIEDDVEIGANTCIDRGKFSATRIGRGTKIDNLVMIAHNVEIGPFCIITAQCGLAGSSKLGAGSAMGGQSGIVHGVTLGREVRIAAQSAATTDFEDGSSIMGMPAQNKTDHFRQLARLRQLPDLVKELTRLTRRVDQLEAAADHSKRG